jgi:hypothetical protein
MRHRKNAICGLALLSFETVKHNLRFECYPEVLSFNSGLLGNVANVGESLLALKLFGSLCVAP